MNQMTSFHLSRSSRGLLRVLRSQIKRALDGAGMQADRTKLELSGSRDQPVIFDDDETVEADAGDEDEGASGAGDTGRIEWDAGPHTTFATSELASGPTKSTDASGPWYDVEEGCYIKEPAPGLGPCEQQPVPSAPAQARSRTFSESFTLLQHQTNLQGVSNITRSTSVESAVHSLLKPFDSSDDGWTGDSMAELEKELELALEEEEEEQGNSSSASAPTSSCARTVEAPQDEIQSRERTETTESRPEPQDASRNGIAQGIEEWEQRETRMVVEILGRREPQEELVGKREEQRWISKKRLQDKNTDDTCDTGDEDPRPSKRRKPRSAPAVTGILMWIRDRDS